MPEHSSTGHDRTHSHSEGGPRRPPSVPDHELLRRIGQGAYGEVWLARNVVGTLRAVKLVYRDAFTDTRPYEREFQGIQKFEPLSRTHEGLVDILQIGINEPAGYFYYVMELADAAEPRVERENELRVESGAPADSLSHRMGEGRGEGNPSQLSTQDSLNSYSPRTLASDLKSQGRLPFSQCLRTALALADALEHLHRQGLIHRDIKPSNIIFVNGTPKLADIGLVTETGAGKSWVGTEGFMPPEGPGTAQGDVYSLGKVLYEISTGKDRQRFPEPLTALADLPDQEDWLEFNEVVAKACEGDPKRRYASASELRADLALLLGGKSVLEIRRLERLWARSRYVAAAALAVLVIGGIVIKSRFDVARARSKEAESRATAASEREKQHEWALTMQDLQTTLLSPRQAGWSSNVLAKAQAAARIRNKDIHLQALASGSLSGVDAWEVQRFEDFNAMSVNFDASGQRLLAGGLNGGALLLESNTTLTVRLQSPGPGPAAFRPGGQPVQLVATNPSTFLLWHLTEQRPVQSFQIGGHRNWDEVPTRKGPVLGISPDCSTVAGAATATDGTGVLAVWDVASGRNLFRVEQRTTALAFAPDGKFLATGAEDGRVHVYSVPGGALLASNKFSRTAVGSLAFQRTVNRKAGSPSPLQNLLLAVGEAASTIRLWHLDDARPLRTLRGGEHAVEAVAFSPDGAYLATGTHAAARLFDIASGLELLAVDATANVALAVAFSRDGGKLAVGGRNTRGAASVVIHAVQQHRGIQVLSGLETEVQKVQFSHDGRWIAALADDWCVAVWNRSNGNLRHVFEAPCGASTDNAALAISRDGTQLAVSAGSEAVLWDLLTGATLVRRKLPPGLTEQLAFIGTNKLMLFRLERSDGLGRPRSQDAVGLPQHCCIRNLLPTDLSRPVANFAEFNWGILHSAVFPDGRFFVADGITVSARATNRSVQFLDPLTGESLRRIDLGEVHNPNGPLPRGLGAIDPAATCMALGTGQGEQSRLLLSDVTTNGRIFRDPPDALAPGGNIWARVSLDGFGRRVYLFEGAEHSPVLAIGPDRTPGFIKSPVFDLTGRFLAWGNTDGTVSIADLEETKRHLAELGFAR